MPNLLQSILNRNSRVQKRLPVISPLGGKYPQLTRSNLHQMTQSWYNQDYPVFMNGNSVLDRPRRRPQSLIVSPDPNTMWDFSRRPSYSMFGSIPEQGQNELVSNSLTVAQSYGNLPENDTTLEALPDPKETQQKSCQKTNSTDNTT
ncbi:unnamed protein product [Rodentolepis nana]|uniref:GAB2 n=1 Tax=Rodentolepis nana TaxID=102285 RepID=A0A158QJ26_RODNA|nr:unnamed protein product [Rodentolepis nana]